MLGTKENLNLTDGRMDSAYQCPYYLLFSSMAIVARVPLGFPTPSFSSSLSKSSQCHKHRHSLVALSTTSIRVIPETSTLFSPYIILSNSPFLQKRDTKGFRRVKVVSAAMADLAPSTVLVTGAGGRTGLIPSLSFSLFFFFGL